MYLCITIMEGEIKLTRKERVEKIRTLLDAAYPDVKCSLNYSHARRYTVLKAVLQ